MMQWTPGPATVLSSTGRYEAFPVAASNGRQVLVLWRSAKAYAHAADSAATIRAAVGDLATNRWGAPVTVHDDGDPIAETSPAGLDWDATRGVWVMLALVKRFTGPGSTKVASYRAQILTSPDGLTWTPGEQLPETGAAWNFASDLKVDGGTWIACGYGEITGRRGWAPIVRTSTDAGATWSAPATLTGFSEKAGTSEPQVIKLADGSWLMSLRGDRAIHTARSHDAGQSWTYAGVAIRDASGSPELGLAPNGDVIMLLRDQPVVDDTHGSWAYAVSTDNGATWTRRDDFPSHAYMMYGALVTTPDGLVCAFSSEDDTAKLWATASILVTRFTWQPAPVTPEARPQPRQADVWKPPQWRYLAYRMNGDGTETVLHPEIPFTDVELEYVLSGTGSFKGTLSVEQAQFLGTSADSLFVPWQTMVVAEFSGIVYGCWIVTEVDEQGPQLQVQASSFPAYAKDIPFEGEVTLTNVDACDAYRKIWDNIQAQPHGNIGLRLDRDTRAGVYLGRVPVEQWKKVTDGDKQTLWPVGAQFRFTWVKTPAVKASTKKTTKLVNGKRVPTTVSKPAKPAVMESDWYGECTRTYPAKVEAGSMVVLRNKVTGVITRDQSGKGLPAGYEVFGVITKKAPKVDDDGTQLEPFTLNWFTDFDLQSRLDSVCEQGHFDYVESHAWNGDALTHTLRFAAPTAGRVRDDLRFIVGENVTESPQLQQLADGYASEVIVLGAGEGRAMVRGTWVSPQPRPRRVKVVTDKTIRTKAEADRRASLEAQGVTGGITLTSITVIDHQNAPIGSWNLGDTITVWGSADGWAANFTAKVRVLSWTLNPETSTATLTVAPAERTS